MTKLDKLIFLKSISWRLVGTIDTFIISLLLSKEIYFANQITLFDFLSKLILFYFFEKIWIKSNFNNEIFNLIGKSIIWRIIATLATFIIVIIITGEVKLGIQISIVELITKLILFVFHEKIWINIKKQ